MEPKLFRWDHGRQDGRYSKLLLAISNRFKFDCYLIKVPDGCAIMQHRDPVAEGFEHHRVNIVLNRFGRWDRNMHVEGPCYSSRLGRIMKFRPDIQTHGMRHINQNCTGDWTYMLSIGWLRKTDEQS